MVSVFRTSRTQLYTIGSYGNLTIDLLERGSTPVTLAPDLPCPRYILPQWPKILPLRQVGNGEVRFAVVSLRGSGGGLGYGEHACLPLLEPRDPLARLGVDLVRHDQQVGPAGARPRGLVPELPLEGLIVAGPPGDVGQQAALGGGAVERAGGGGAASENAGGEAKSAIRS